MNALRRLALWLFRPSVLAGYAVARPMCRECLVPLASVILDATPALVCPVCGSVGRREATWAEFVEAL